MLPISCKVKIFLIIILILITLHRSLLDILFGKGQYIRRHENKEVTRCGDKQNKSSINIEI